MKYSIRGKTLPLEFHPITQHRDDVVLERELVRVEKFIIYVSKTLTSLKHSVPICKLMIIISLYTFGNCIVYMRKAITFWWSVSLSKQAISAIQPEQSRPFSTPFQSWSQPDVANNPLLYLSCSVKQSTPSLTGDGNQFLSSRGRASYFVPHGND